MSSTDADTDTYDPARQCLADYHDFRYSVAVLTPDVVATLSAAFEKVRGRSWYGTAMEAAYKAALESRRIVGDTHVADADEGIDDVMDLTDVVEGGGAIDVAVAILVRDLIAAEDYRRLTSWWGRGGDAAWLPQPLPEQPVTVDPAAMADVTAVLEAQPDDEPAVALAPPRRPVPQQRGGDVPPPSPDEVLARAAQRRKAKRDRLRRVRRIRRGAFCLLLVTPLLLLAAGDQLGGRLLPPGELLPRLTGAGIWLALAIAAVLVSARRFRRAEDVHRGSQ